MSTTTIKGYLIAYHWDHMESDRVVWTFRVYHDEKTQSENTVMAIPYEFTAEVPDKVDIVAGLVRGLEAAKLKALEDYQESVKKINRRLSELQAIECAA